MRLALDCSRSSSSPSRSHWRLREGGREGGREGEREGGRERGRKLENGKCSVAGLNCALCI